MIVKKLSSNSKRFEMNTRLLLWFGIFLFTFKFSYNQTKEPPDSLAFMRYSGKELYQKECWDTIRFLFFKRPVELGVIFPSWLAIEGHQNFTELEGMVSMQTAYNSVRGPHISEEDFPNFHYSHDFCFNVFPDSAYKHLLCYFNTEDGQWACRTHMHVEWESGLANGNSTNPLASAMQYGNSSGFISFGHTRKQAIEHWPSIGDWVHLEGIYVWDRGHPPAKTEIHPIFFMLIKRRIPSIINHSLALRIDLFANGDGSAFYNNLPNQPSFVFPTLMNQKDYQVSVELPDYLQNTDFDVIIHKQSGHTSPISCSVKKINDKQISVNVPWKSQNIDNQAKFHQTIYLVPNKKINNNEYQKVVVNLLEIKRRKSLDFLRKPQLRVFANIHQKYFFVNEWSPSKDILNDGWGKSCKRKWNFLISDTLIIHKDSLFRVQFSAWEADGVDKVFGELLDQNCDCEYNTRKKMMKRLMRFRPVGVNGCKDDVLKEGFQYHKASEIQGKQKFILYNFGELQDDPCPFGKFNPSKRLRLTYTIEKMNNEQIN